MVPAAALTLALAVASARSDAVPPLSIDPKGVSISGLSSGADFTAQFQVAFSELVMGSGVFAGQPWRCAVQRFPKDEQFPQCDRDTKVNPGGCTGAHPAPSVPICDGCDAGKTLQYDHCKNHPDSVDVDALAATARAAGARGDIDGLGNLTRARIYLYRGTKDATYYKGSVKNVGRLLEALGVPAASVLFNDTTPSAHSWPTPSAGTPCGEGVIEACGYDGPGAALSHIYAGGGGLRRPANLSAFPAENLQPFDQRSFFSADNNGTAVYNATTPRATGLAPNGMLYVPTRCRAPGAKCKLHLSLHGCAVDEYYDAAVKTLGFEAWGEANGIVVLFPRVQPHGYTVETTSGCWDAYAQTGADYAFKSGVQMQAVRQMIRAIAGF